MTVEERIEQIARMLGERPRTKWDLAYELDLSVKYVDQILRKLRAAGRTRIVSYARPRYDNGQWTSVHGAGPGEDAPRPHPTTCKVRRKRYVSRLKRFAPEKYELRLLKNRIRSAIRWKSSTTLARHLRAYRELTGEDYVLR